MPRNFQLKFANKAWMSRNTTIIAVIEAEICLNWVMYLVLLLLESPAHLERSVSAVDSQGLHHLKFWGCDKIVMEHYIVGDWINIKQKVVTTRFFGSTTKYSTCSAYLSILQFWVALCWVLIIDNCLACWEKVNCDFNNRWLLFLHFLPCM